MTLSDLTLADNTLLDAIIQVRADIRRSGSTIKLRKRLKGLTTAKSVVEYAQKQLKERTPA